MTMPIMAMATTTMITARRPAAGPHRPGPWLGRLRHLALGGGRRSVLRLRVPAMDCGAEEAEIRRALEPLAGIRALRFDLGRRQLSVQAPEALFPAVEAALKRLGMPGERLPDGGAPASAERVWPRLAGALAAAVAAEALAALAPAGCPGGWPAWRWRCWPSRWPAWAPTARAWPHCAACG
jgi:Cd2+/Zn2+-exporting ATPase